MAINIGNKKSKIYIGNAKVSKVYLGSTKIYSSGSTCTYICDGSTYQEEIDEGASCLSPKTFTPTKSGWEFAGWRQDAAANGSVLSSLVMGDAPITLYAVFRQTITLSYNGNSATSGSTATQTAYRYYNNGNVANPSFTLRSNGFSRSGYIFSKWALGSAGGTQYAAGASVTLAASTTMYAVWKASSIVVTGSSSYISPSRTNMGAGVWYQNSYEENTDTVTVNYAGYNKVTIEFYYMINNAGGAGKPIELRINGITVVNNKTDYGQKINLGTAVSYSGTTSTFKYTATYTGITQIPIYTYVGNPEGKTYNTWADMRVSINSAVLSM